MYRVASLMGDEENGVHWLSWNREQIRLGKPGEATGEKEIAQGRMRDELPVYVQSHALRNLRERVNLSSATAFLDHWLYESLRQPLIVERQGDDLLVEYRILKDRVGYLIVTPLHDCVAVRTFKFLTMEGTPEARKLKERLRLTRRDVDWLGLSELSAFTQTDLSEDPELCELLEECGCGHLFELKNWDFAPQPKAFAAEMRKYLRMAA